LITKVSTATAENQELVIGSGKFIPGFEEQLIGKNIGDETTVEVSFPETYHAEDLAGKPVKFEVKINDIKYKELPALDDEFAKDVSEFDTLEAYKESVKAELEEGAKTSAESAQRDKVIEAVTKLIPVEIPAKMVDAEIDNMLNEFNQQLSYQGLSLEQYIQFTGGSMDDFREQVREDALARVKTSLVIEKVVEQENFEIAEEDIEAELGKIAEMQGSDIEEIRTMFARDNFEYLKTNLKSRKAVDFLVENATLV
jgi:trigger factor